MSATLPILLGRVHRLPPVVQHLTESIGELGSLLGKIMPLTNIGFQIKQLHSSVFKILE